MKKIRLFILLLIMVIFLGGCDLKPNNLDNATVYTTIYPLKYIIEYLYGDNSTIESNYTVGVD